MKINTKEKSNLKTYEGGKAYKQSIKTQLERTVLSTLLWENSFYENGEDIASRIKTLVLQSNIEDVLDLAIKARKEFYLRHVPLLLIVAALKHQSRSSRMVDTIYNVINRPDELTELLAIYWKDGKTPIATQLKKGLAKAFTKFNAYSLAKYNRNTKIKLRDVLFLVHAKPIDSVQAEVWKELINGTLETPDTWETNLSAGNDKKETFTRLIKENKLGYLALLRNLRNMTQSGVSTPLVREAIYKGNKSNILPFRFIAAARAAPEHTAALENAFLESCSSVPKLKGNTVILVDVSGSMEWELSSKSDLSRIDAASALAAILREVSEDIDVFSFSEKLVRCKAYRGFALIDQIKQSQPNYGTYLVRSLNQLEKTMDMTKIDRLIVITDEQISDSKLSNYSFIPNKYIINVASYNNSIAHGSWVSITGFSEKIVNYISAYEN